MKNHWYCGVEGQQYGPFTWEQLRAMAAEGRLIGESFVRREVDQQWFQASQIPGLLPKAHPAKKNGSSASSIVKAGAKVSESGALAAVSADPSKSSSTSRRAKARPAGTASQSSGNIPVGKPAAARSAPVAVGTATPSQGFAFTPAVNTAAS
ncbi:MAG TPA: GYF domain-containing protein, partial [Pirellulaceae bacterium]|nr:GYF domain-containing protein [Pirellulaceae bacterium]